MSGLVIVYAFDPVAELGDQSGILVLPAELAGRLIAEFRAEAVVGHASNPLRFVDGSRANRAARDALRAARAERAAPASSGTRTRKVAKLEQ